MLFTWIVTGIVLVIALVVIMIVAISAGSMTDRAPDDLTNVALRATEHLNGDAEPPKQLVDFFGAIPELRPSARSADSASLHGTPTRADLR